MTLSKRNLIALTFLLGSYSEIFSSFDTNIDVSNANTPLSDINTGLIGNSGPPAEKKSAPVSPVGTYYYQPTTQEYFTYADWLYWKPVTDPIDWAGVDLFQVTSINLTGTQPALNFNDQVIQEDLTFPYSSGFRIGIGYRFRENETGKHSWPWQFEASYERLSTATSSKLNTQGILQSETVQVAEDPGVSFFVITELESVIPLAPSVLTNILPSYQEAPPIEVVIKSGQSRMSLEYNRGDTKFLWPIWLKNTAILRLATGATFANIISKWSASYQTSYVPEIGTPACDYTTFLKWNWGGGGVFAGGDITVEIGRGVGFYADTSVAALYGRMNQVEKYTVWNGNRNNYYLRVTRSYYSFQPVVKFAAGLNYKHWVSSILLYASAGWEFNYWFDMNQFGKVSSRSKAPGLGRYFMQTKPQSLLFEGLTMRIGLEF